MTTTPWTTTPRRGVLVSLLVLVVAAVLALRGFVGSC